MLKLSEADHARITDAVRLAETRTAAELICVVAAAASEYRFTSVLWAAVLALVLPWPLWWFTQIEVASILISQILVFCLSLFLLSWHPLRLWLTPRSIRRADVERAAERQFSLIGITRTKRRAGVVIYVSLAERVAVILPDAAARDVLTLSISQNALAALTQKLRHGEVTEGFLAAIAVLAEALAIVLPAIPGEANELSDQVIEA